MERITSVQKELGDAVRDISSNMQSITEYSANVSGETQDVMDSIINLQDTTDKFNV